MEAPSGYAHVVAVAAVGDGRYLCYNYSSPHICASTCIWGDTNLFVD
jgi:hypothetical protein